MELPKKGDLFLRDTLSISDPPLAPAVIIDVRVYGYFGSAEWGLLISDGGKPYYIAFNEHHGFARTAKNNLRKRRGKRIPLRGHLVQVKPNVWHIEKRIDDCPVYREWRKQYGEPNPLSQQPIQVP